MEALAAATVGSPEADEVLGDFDATARVVPDYGLSQCGTISSRFAIEPSCQRNGKRGSTLCQSFPGEAAWKDRYV
ncbi:MAG: hypothetical protein QOE49_2481 [Rhodospirillaceae bacterium]|nr:hypothetical protein [Rhodospirillaceae bacterium]MEA2809580.1 hypothetical protein [Rhodospirillaceae bacterium]